MNRIGRLRGAVVLAVVAAFLLAGCGGGEVGQSECSCAAGVTYDKTFYQQYANTSVHAEAAIGKSDVADDCCGDSVRQVTVYSIEGVDPTIAIATKDADGITYFNVASELAKHDQKIADRFAREHHLPDRE
ncbi:hypothetical protein ASC61_00695 [Aeromicrobium sp. Root344]|uniref:DUF6281 family protein n=1 Tax=Aeromicrobium sp. Root344 TaxID=1736521 RepID=UPI0006FFEA5B|nr:DUF6281 family protein [Aeromicrobium sp. Root344]KQV73653.1 hypothetical protein ASC61_00695 [Aeromicrobium sp. Root344]